MPKTPKILSILSIGVKPPHAPNQPQKQGPGVATTPTPRREERKIPAIGLAAGIPAAGPR